MSDDPKKHKQDGKLISLTQPHERRYWTKRLGVTIERLVEAVEKKGNSVKRVCAYMATDRFAKGGE